MHGEAGNDTLVGDGGNDVLDAAGGRDKISGGKGDDVLDGGANHDVLHGGDGNDTLIGGRGPDRLDGGPGTDTADYSSSGTGITVNLATGAASGGDAKGDTVANVENLNASGFRDRITGNSAPNEIYGNGGNDVLSGAGGDDLLDGGQGRDKLFGQSGKDTLQGYDGNDTLLGGGGADGLDGGAGQDEIYGGGGNDALVGGGAIVLFDRANNTYLVDETDSLDGGAGNDTLTAASGSVLMIGGAGNDSIVATDDGSFLDFMQVSYRSSTAGIVVTPDGSGSLTVEDGLGGTDTVSGVHLLYDSGHDDTITVDTTYQTSFGTFLEVRLSAGNDSVTFDGFAGRIAYKTAGGAVLADLEAGTATDLNPGDNFIGNDTFIGTVQVLRGSGFGDELYGSSGNDRFRGEGGNDTIDGRGGIDRVEFSSALTGVNVDLSQNKVLDDGVGGQDTVMNIEQVTGSPFDDLITGDGNDNRLDGGLGDDVIHGGDGNDSIIGDFGLDPEAITAGATSNDELYGDAGNDTLQGGDGNDTLQGGDGNDSLDGGAGQDEIYGGAGNDALVGGGSAVVFDRANNTYLVNETDSLDGGAGNDTLTAASGSVLMIGGAGNDSIIATDDGSFLDFMQVSYRSSTAGIVVAPDGSGSLTVQDGLGGTDTVSGVHLLYDSGHDDTITVDSSYQTSFGTFLEVRLSAGNDSVTFDGFAGRIAYNTAGGAVLADLEAGTATDLNPGDNFIGNDTFIGTVQVLRGSGFGDELYGSSGNDRLRGEGGNDTIDGRGGIDRVEFSSALTGVNVDLSQNKVIDDGLGGHDTVMNIEQVSGSSFDDLIAGDGNDNRLDGRLGDDVIHGGDGNDSVIGDFGLDPEAITAGATSNDELYGDAGNDTLQGGDGNDLLTGGAGADSFTFADGFGNDTIADFAAVNAETINLANVSDIANFDDLVGNHLQADLSTGFALIVSGSDSILLEGITVGDIGVGNDYSAEDFIF